MAACPHRPFTDRSPGGYVYDAKFRMASLLRTFGDNSRADKLKQEAAAMAKRLGSYWMAEQNYYAIALDNNKSPVQIVSSNPGHLLFSRAVNKERARSIVKRLMQPDSFRAGAGAPCQTWK